MCTHVHARACASLNELTRTHPAVPPSAHPHTPSPPCLTLTHETHDPTGAPRSSRRCTRRLSARPTTRTTSTATATPAPAGWSPARTTLTSQSAITKRRPVPAISQQSRTLPILICTPTFDPVCRRSHPPALPSLLCTLAAVPQLLPVPARRHRRDLRRPLRPLGRLALVRLSQRLGHCRLAARRIRRPTRRVELRGGSPGLVQHLVAGEPRSHSNHKPPTVFRGSIGP